MLTSDERILSKLPQRAAPERRNALAPRAPEQQAVLAKPFRPSRSGAPERILRRLPQRAALERRNGKPRAGTPCGPGSPGRHAVEGLWRERLGVAAPSQSAGTPSRCGALERRNGWALRRPGAPEIRCGAYGRGAVARYLGIEDREAQSLSRHELHKFVCELSCTRAPRVVRALGRCAGRAPAAQLTRCLTMTEGAVDLTLSDDDAGAAVKQEVKPEADDGGFEGAYDCLMCFTSCRRQPALHCTACTCNPWHVSCAAGTQFARVCPQCARASVAPWTRGRFVTLQHSEEFCVDLVAEEEAAEERQREREREESRKRELEERQRELEREGERKRELERAREEEKERARAREDATRREQERAREEEERNRQRKGEREEEERKRSRARERGRADRHAADQREERDMRDAKRWQTAHSDAATDDEEEADEHSRSTKYEDEFIAVLRQSAAGKKDALLLLQPKTQEQQQQQPQLHLPAFAGAKGNGKAAARPPLPSAPSARGSGGACPPLSSYLKTAADTSECMDMGPGAGGGASAAPVVVWDKRGGYTPAPVVWDKRACTRLLNAVRAESFGEITLNPGQDEGYLQRLHLRVRSPDFWPTNAMICLKLNAWLNTFGETPEAFAKCEMSVLYMHTCIHTCMRSDASSAAPPPQAKPARRVANLPSAEPGRSAGARGYVDIHGAYVENGASPIKADPGRRRGDIARIKKLSRDKLHKTVMK
jgi:hypothetical protein